MCECCTFNGMKLSTYLSTHSITRARFAELADIAHTTVSRLLDEGMIPRRDTCQRISKATHGEVSEGDLLIEATEARLSARSDDAA